MNTAATTRTTSPFLHAYAVFVALCIVVLICSGGTGDEQGRGPRRARLAEQLRLQHVRVPGVALGGGRVVRARTSPDRVVRSDVLTLGLTAWIYAADRRRKWMRVLGVAATAAVIIQGVMGGLRVVELWDWMGIFHACLAQAFLALVSFIALATSRWWFALGGPEAHVPDARRKTRRLGKALLLAAHLIFLQLALGATMRHAHAGLSIPDFPTAYGHWWPQVHRADLPALNAARDAAGQPATTLAQIHLQMTHRLNAFLVLALVASAAVAAWRRRGLLPDSLRWLASAGVLFIAMQTTLGIYTIWTNKAADVATAHVAVGAASFVWAVLTPTPRGVAGPIPRRPKSSAPSPRQWRTPPHETCRPHRTGRACRTADGLARPRGIVPGRTGASAGVVRRPVRTGQGAAELADARHDAGRILHGLARADGLPAAWAARSLARRSWPAGRRRSTN